MKLCDIVELLPITRGYHKTIKVDGGRYEKTLSNVSAFEEYNPILSSKVRMHGRKITNPAVVVYLIAPL